MVVIVFTAFMLIADTVTLIHQHHESQKEHALLAGGSEGSNPPDSDLRSAGTGATE